MKNGISNRCQLAVKDGRILFPRLDVARAFIPRLLGLLRYPRMPEGLAVLFPQCRAVHTFFMRFPIDIAFLSEDYRVVEMYPAVSEGRLITNRKGGGRHTLEAAAGLFQQLNLNHHEQLEIRHL